LLRAAALRRGEAAPVDVALLCRRNGIALAFALIAMFAAGAAVPGQAPAWKILVGPVIALLAAVSVVRARWLARKLDSQLPFVVREPVTDALVVARRWLGGSIPVWSVRSSVVLAPTAALAAVAAFAWGLTDDQGTVASSLVAAGIEAALTVAGFLVLGPLLGLRTALHPNQSDVTP
jgi:hypothetical protein